MEENDFWFYEEAIENLKKDIRTVKNFKEYLEKEDYENMSNNLEDFLNNEIKEKQEKLTIVIKRFEKAKNINLE
jgi:transcription elongation factor GreA-like protein